MVSNNPIVKALVEIFAAKGIKHVIFSPGSRNAPIAVSIFNDARFTARVIADERSAGFIALGIALESKQPVVLCCTSGTALLNYAPAVAEAHYQNIPLIVLSADRPEEFIDQGEGQSINQKNVFANYINKSVNLPRAITDNDVQWHVERTINEVVDACYFPKIGPVHINVPFTEPLYQFEEPNQNYQPKIINRTATDVRLSTTEQQRLEQVWKASSKKLIVCGQMPTNKRLNHLLDNLANDTSVVVLAENLSNLYSKRFVSCTDRVIASINNANIDTFAPDLLITIGDAVVSKRIKTMLRNIKPHHHWDVNTNHFHYDTYQSLTESIHVLPEAFFESFSQQVNPQPSDYANKWKTLDYTNQEKHEAFLQSAPYSDFKAFSIIHDFIPEGVALHLSNSSVIRYAQLFDTLKDVSYYSNRGVSGIEGSTSTALGCSLVNDKVNVLITGDISFFYDSNALWNKYLHPKFKIIMINNSGGGIFRYIPGPSDTNILEEFFEAKQNYSAREICHTFGVEHLLANDETSLERQLEVLLTNFERPMLLEVKTPAELNPQVLKDYFNHLK
ncbi:MAG: 2-succinyl-5-enolpyruvyl-6-hydroxy-3-cyclohexene-1-carboxylic-acid synthase [Bacteroidia bacterium]